MKFLAVVIGVILAAFALRMVLAVAFTLLHFVLVLAVVAAVVAAGAYLFKVISDDAKSSDTH